MLSEGMEYCPFCGTSEITLSRLDSDQHGPEYCYSCSSCGPVRHQGIWRENVASH